VNSKPLVSVICLSHNHQQFVEEAIQSVLNQTYDNIQIIVIDDGSVDNSAGIIEDLVRNHPSVIFIRNASPKGNCKAFNQALAHAQGKYIIDFATDDVLLADRVQMQVDFFESLDESYGVIFTNALYIDATGTIIRDHYKYLFRKGLLKTIPVGDVYADVLSTYFIASPTMMIRKKVLDELNGYDENLAYEDFDFWVRAARHYKFGFLDKVTTKIRRNTTSMSSGWYKPGDAQLYSTYLVCRKARQLNRTDGDKLALIARLQYEIRQSVFSENRQEAGLFYELLREMKRSTLFYDFLFFINKLNLPLRWMRACYHKIRYS